MKGFIIFALIPVFIFVLIVNYAPDAQALSIYDFGSCKDRFEHLKKIGVHTYARMFSNSEASRFCMYMFEEGIFPREIKDHYEISKLELEIDLPKNWSGWEIDAENMTIAFVIPDKRKSGPVEPLWIMLVTTDKLTGQGNFNQVSEKIAESLNDVPNFTNTCKFNEPKSVEINGIMLEEQIVRCIDRRLSLFVTIPFYSFITEEHEIFLISATRHHPSYDPDYSISDFLQTLKSTKTLINTGNVDMPVSEIKKDDTPSWFKKYIGLWGKEKLTDREFISLFNFIFKNDILNISYYSNPGFYNEAKVPDWFRNNGIWLSKDLISEDEFFASYKYLVKNRIIII